MVRDYSHIDVHLEPRKTINDRMEEGVSEDSQGLLYGLQAGLNLIIRLLGAALMVVGLVIGLMVIKEAWTLYREPTHIEPLVQAIEQQANMDAIIASLGGSDSTDNPGGADADIISGTEGNSTTSTEGRSFRLAYFPAWFIAIIMLLLIGRLSLAAVHTGGQLALYDRQMRNLARSLLREVGNR